MSTPSRSRCCPLMKTTVVSLVAASLALAGLFAVTHAEEPIAPDQQKKADAAHAEGDVKKPEALPPAPKVEVTEAAKPVIDRMREAYGKLAGLQQKGTWTVEYDIEGEKGRDLAPFESSFAAPNKFRYEIKNDLLFGSTGEKAYAFKKNQYLLADAPKSRGAIDALPQQSQALLKEKDPSLLFAVADEETPFLAERATRIDKGADVTLDGKAFTALTVATQQAAEVRVLVDPSTNLMRQWTIDLKRALEQRGQQDVKAATMTIDYAEVKAEAPPAAEAFAWVPPAGAKDAATMAAGPDAAQALVGKPAPAFELESMDGKKVKLADLKGSVVVLDFWATWCGPCRAGMPILETVAKARADKKDLKVFTVNVEEDKETVAAFVRETKFGLPVLLDLTGETSAAYFGNVAIPLTIIVGKDGVVKKAMVGLHPQPELESAIDAAVKG